MKKLLVIALLIGGIIAYTPTNPWSDKSLKEISDILDIAAARQLNKI